ncbi:MAG: twin-arginine translocase TatA/TatE family subunit [Alphaproteobacteria bacterium]|nr:twin-arginine translocase TatA/TatE family subunit [Alphaproteobacteria bacterium]
MRLGWLEILVIVVLIMILFGYNKIPSMMKNVASGINIFKNELKNTKTEKQTAKMVAKKKVTQKQSVKKRK